jgi:hypothetical protein
MEGSCRHYDLGVAQNLGHDSSETGDCKLLHRLPLALASKREHENPSMPKSKMPEDAELGGGW